MNDIEAMIEIALHGPRSAGRTALISPCDFDLVSTYKWRVYQASREGKKDDGPYAFAHTRRTDGSRTTIRMHNLILGVSGVDHVNGNGLDNRRVNLRPATRSQNGFNVSSRANGTSKYKGVCWHKRKKGWQASIKIDGKLIYLGRFADEAQAARAYDAAARELHGEFARFNFPDPNCNADLPAAWSP